MPLDSCFCYNFEGMSLDQYHHAGKILIDFFYKKNVMMLLSDLCA